MNKIKKEFNVISLCFIFWGIVLGNSSLVYGSAFADEEEFRPQLALSSLLREDKSLQKLATRQYIVEHTHEWPHYLFGKISWTVEGCEHSGSGTLVGPNLVLTAAHVLFHPDTPEGSTESKAPRNPHLFHFYPGKNGEEEPYERVGVLDYHYVDYSFRRDKLSNEDWALLVLERNIGEELQISTRKPGWFDLRVCLNEELKKEGKHGRAVEIFGYPGDLINKLSAAKGTLKSYTNHAFSYELNTIGGQSGGGVIAEFEGKKYLIGNHQGRIKDKNWAIRWTEDKHKKYLELGGKECPSLEEILREKFQREKKKLQEEDQQEKEKIERSSQKIQDLEKIIQGMQSYLPTEREIREKMEEGIKGLHQEILQERSRQHQAQVRQEEIRQGIEKRSEQFNEDLVKAYQELKESRQKQAAEIAHLREEVEDLKKRPVGSLDPLSHDQMLNIMLEAEYRNRNLISLDEKGKTPFFKMCEEGDLSRVQFLLKKGVDIATPDSQGRTPFYIACANGHQSVVEELIEQGVDINQPYQPSKISKRYDKTPFFIACERGQIGIVETLMTHGVKDIDSSGFNDTTPLYVASQNGHLSVVEALIKKKVNINYKSEVLHGTTALCAACEGGHWPVADFLIRQGANVNDVPTSGRSPLYVVCSKGDLLFTEGLVSHGANVNQIGQHGRAPLSIASENGHLSVVKFLIGQKANVNHQAEYGNNALLQACHHLHFSVVEELINNGADPNLRLHNENTILHSICSKSGGNTIENNKLKELIKYLVEHGANPNLRNKEGKTVLDTVLDMANNPCYSHVDFYKELTEYFRSLLQC